MRLSLASGWDIDDILDWDANKLNLWLAFHSLEPFGQEWFQTASLQAQQYNLNRGNGKPAKSPYDFMPNRKGDALPATALNVRRAIARAKSSLNAK